LKGWR